MVDSDPHYSGACVCAVRGFASRYSSFSFVSFHLYLCTCIASAAAAAALAAVCWLHGRVMAVECIWLGVLGRPGGATFPSSVGSVTDRGLLLIRPACVAVGRSSVCNWLRTSPLIAYTWSIRSAPDLDSVLSSYPQPTRHPDQKFYLNYSEYMGLFLCTVKLCFICFLFTGC